MFTTFFPKIVSVLFIFFFMNLLLMKMSIEFLKDNVFDWSTMFVEDFYLTNGYYHKTYETFLLYKKTFHLREKFFLS